MKAKMIVERQKKKYEDNGLYGFAGDCVRAIAEIEALEVERDRYKEALEWIVKHDIYCAGVGDRDADSCDVMQNIAKNALSNNQQDRKEKQ